MLKTQKFCLDWSVTTLLLLKFCQIYCDQQRQIYFFLPAEPTTTPKFQTRPPVTPSPTTTTSSTTTTVTTTRSISSTSTATTHKSTQSSTEPTKPPVVSPKSCQGGYVRNITWPTTSPRDTAFEICPNNRFGKFWYTCDYFYSLTHSSWRIYITVLHSLRVLLIFWKLFRVIFLTSVGSPK